MNTSKAIRVRVRPAFSEQAVWRDALGPTEPLFALSIDGDLSAREYIPAGAMKSTKYGPRPVLASYHNEC